MLEQLHLMRGQFARLTIHHGKTAERHAFGAEHRHARIETNMGLTRNKWIICKPLVFRGIWNNKAGLLLSNGLNGKGGTEFQLFLFKAVCAFNPFLVIINK